MILLTFGIAIFDTHTRLARLETSAPVPLLLAALGAAAGRRHISTTSTTRQFELKQPAQGARGGQAQIGCDMRRLLFLILVVITISSSASLLLFLHRHYDNRKLSVVLPRMKSTPLHSASKDDDDRPIDHDSIHHAVVIHHEHNRRVILATLLTTSASTLYPSVLCAINDDDDEFDNMSTLTRQIRRSVVRGAQLIDTVDGAWERFSDDFGLGSKRNLPKRNVIDAGGNAVTKKFVTSSELPMPFFDETFALDILRLCDEAFLQCLTYQQPQPTMNKVELNQQIDQTKQYLRKSFFSSSSDNHAPPSREEEYNFDCYIHFRVYNDILIKRNVIFPPFYKAFERMIGTCILRFAIQQQYHSGLASSSLAQSLNNALSVTDNIATLLQTKGLIASWERSLPLDDTIDDFVDDNNNEDSANMYTTELTYSLALNGEITLNSQLLLQELGYRLYPSFGRWMVNEALLQCFLSHPLSAVSLPINGNNNNSSSSSRNSTAQIIVNIDDYYMDTSYNSNPDLFEVKQILLNIVIQQD